MTLKGRKACNQVLLNVAAEHGITVRELLHGGRSRHLLDARLDAMRQLREEGLTQERIAYYLCLDRTTVVHHLRKERA